ncbi:MAG: hypothetical protein K8R46_07545, partial [Pirellulales bacterium]|nr:hypothetical protein [Pirellulales bacterium]
VDQPGVELGLRLKRGRQSEMNSPGFKRFERIGGPRRIDVRIKWRFQKFFPVNSSRKIDRNLNNNIGLWRQGTKLIRIAPPAGYAQRGHSTSRKRLEKGCFLAAGIYALFRLGLWRVQKPLFTPKNQWAVVRA